MLLQPVVVIQECKKEFALNTVADPDFKLRRGAQFYFTCPASLSSFSHFFFFTQNKGMGMSPGPLS